DNGTLTLKGTANFTGNNDFNVGDVGASVGTLNIQDTASLTVNSFFIGSANAAGSTASGTVHQTGGTVTQVSSATGAFAVGGRLDTTSIGGAGVYNINGGVLNAASAIRIGAGGVGTFNQNGGTVNAGVDVNIARFAGSTGTYNLNGGTLRTARVTSSTGANATFNLNGGVLLAREDNTSIITNIPMVNVRDGGAVVDSTNFNVTISSALQHSFIAGDNAIDGGLTKLGNGTLTLTASGSYYTGPTVVMGGALNLSPGSVASLNNLTLSNAALGLALNGGVTTYYATDLKLAGNSALNLSYDLISGAPVAAINGSGSLTASGKTTINVFGYGWPVGQFTLVDYTGTPLANLNNFALGALPYGVTASLSNNVANTSIDLVVTAVSVANWIPLAATDSVGMSSFNTAGYWQDGNPPTAGNGYLTKSFALRSPADTNAYTFAGTALSVDSGGRFIMKGTNGQTITINNLILNGGVVDYANSGDNFTETLAGNLTLQGGITSYLGALGSAGAAETLFVTAPIGGAGNLQFAGPSVNGGQDNGLVVLAGTNSYTGTTTVAGGTLLVNGSNGNSVITVNANATLGGLGSSAGPVTVQSGGTLAPGTPSRGALSAALGTLTVGGTATVSGTVWMKIERSATPSSDRLNAPTVVVNPGATLVVTNLGSANFVAGDTFSLFSTPVSGSFTVANWPPLPSPDLYWTNRLAVNGTIAVASTVTVNPTPTHITATVSGNTLTLSWPADHLGWRLQVQTNAVGVGLGTNWVAVPGSEAVTATNLTIDPANDSVFYRIVYP
ncbi:MAG TPA: autotransporter-associated beta strand repeat-containing protein, partial [Bacillota bacterium]|nr:autotransporter-associated beta strand repeat-containing protein [Bacillota bacterium]